ncbi:hypothetical protein [uncultured Kordia sp.]|nr:hypothetical protein [uncultured Kordia sp.]
MANMAAPVPILITFQENGIVLGAVSSIGSSFPHDSNVDFFFFSV